MSPEQVITSSLVYQKPVQANEFNKRKQYGDLRQMGNARVPKTVRRSAHRKRQCKCITGCLFHRQTCFILRPVFFLTPEYKRHKQPMAMEKTTAPRPWPGRAPSPFSWPSALLQDVDGGAGKKKCHCRPQPGSFFMDSRKKRQHGA